MLQLKFKAHEEVVSLKIRLVQLCTLKCVILKEMTRRRAGKRAPDNLKG